jgi:integrase
MAWVKKRGGQKWYAIYVDASGKKKWVAGFADKGESLRLAIKLETEQRQIKLGQVDPQIEIKRKERGRSVSDQIQSYQDKLEAAGRSANHVAYTIADIKKLVAFGKLKSAGEITSNLIDSWVVSLKNADSNSTINRRVGSVQAFLKTLSENGGVTDYVLRKYPKLPTGTIHKKRNMRALTDAEIIKLLAVPEVERQELYKFALGTGLRLNECRQMTAEYFDFKNNSILIPAHISKAKRNQMIPIRESLVSMLVKRVSKGGLIFNIGCTANVNADLKSDCESLNINKQDVSFHSFRHSFCTCLARANVHPALLQKLARHQDVHTTLKYYVHLQRDDEIAAINKLPY